MGFGALVSRLEVTYLDLLCYYDETNVILILRTLALFAAFEPCMTIAWIYPEIERKKDNKPHLEKMKDKQLVSALTRSILFLLLNGFGLLGSFGSLSSFCIH